MLSLHVSLSLTFLLATSIVASPVGQAVTSFLATTAQPCRLSSHMTHTRLLLILIVFGHPHLSCSLRVNQELQHGCVQSLLI